MKHLTNLFISLLLLTFSFNLYATDIKMSIDRSHIELNETFTLIFNADGDPDDDPDFSPLTKDFKILNQSTSSNISIINGQYTRSKKWNVSLLALRKGTIAIPPIHFGSDVSTGYQVTILSPKTSTGKQGEAFMSELEINTNTVFTQAQILVTQRLLSSSNINAYEFSPLKTKGVEIIQEKLGDVKQYQTKRGDTPYLVIEQRYAIYPQSVGTLTVEASIASARVTIQNSRQNRSAFNPYRNNTKTLRRASKQKQINVNPVPEAFKGKHWLAAREVQLVEEFPDSNTLTVGEPITRTLVLLVDGQLSSQLPEFSTLEVKNLKQYPDKPLLKNNIGDSGITGIQQVKVAIIPSVAGKYILPAISIPWWNTQTNKLEYAKISPRVFEVADSTMSSTTTLQPPQLQTAKDVGAADITPEISTPDKTIKPSENTLIWKIISLILTSALAFALYFLWRKTRPNLIIENTQQINTVSLKQALTNIKHACDNNNAQATKNALLDWAQALFIQESIYSLGDLSNKVETDLARAIQNLNDCLYRNKSEQWQSDNLYDLCMRFSNQHSTQNSQAKKSGKNDQLESLYK